MTDETERTKENLYRCSLQVTKKAINMALFLRDLVLLAEEEDLDEHEERNQLRLMRKLVRNTVDPFSIPDKDFCKIYR